MAVKVNFSIREETDQKLEKMTELTFRRNKGDVIDWLVAEAWNRMNEASRDTVTIEQATSSPITD